MIREVLAVFPEGRAVEDHDHPTAKMLSGSFYTVVKGDGCTCDGVLPQKRVKVIASGNSNQFIYESAVGRYDIASKWPNG